MLIDQQIVIVRGGGDLATGVIQKLHRSGFRVLVLEIAEPTTIRRTVALSQAVYEKQCCVEDITAQRIDSWEQAEKCWEAHIVPILIDPLAESVAALQPIAVIDAILAKRNLGTHRNMAPITVAMGPGFVAGEDVDIVIETMRGHDLGRLIFHGPAFPNTNTPGEIGGRSAERVVHSPVSGTIHHQTVIGDVVEKGQTLFTVDDLSVPAPFTGLLRGLIQDNLYVRKGLKVADVDPRIDVNWHSISDKARCLGGAVLEAVFILAQQ